MPRGLNTPTRNQEPSTHSADSCIRKAETERGLTPALIGLPDTKMEDKAASRGADFAAPMGFEWPDLGPPGAPGGGFGLADRAARRRVDPTGFIGRGRDPGSPHPARRRRSL